MTASNIISIASATLPKGLGCLGPGVKGSPCSKTFLKGAAKGPSGSRVLEHRPELLASMVQECRSMAKGLQDHEQNAGINDVKNLIVMACAC